MDATTVFQVVKALPKEEQKLLLNLLQKDFVVNNKSIKSLSKNILTKQEAFTYLLKNVFGNKKGNTPK